MFTAIGCFYARSQIASLFLDSIDNGWLGSSNFHGVTILILVVDEKEDIERKRVKVKGV